MRCWCYATQSPHRRSRRSSSRKCYRHRAQSNLPRRSRSRKLFRPQSLRRSDKLKEMNGFWGRAPLGSMRFRVRENTLHDNMSWKSKGLGLITSPRELPQYSGCSQKRFIHPVRSGAEFRLGVYFAIGR